MAPTWRFAEFELDPGNQTLLRHGEAVKLAPQPYKVLAVLVSRSGGLVRRDELRQAVWGDTVSVDFEHGVNTCMRQVRAALGEDAETSRIIETIPRVGYRLKVPACQIVLRRRRLARVAGAAVVGVASVALVWTIAAYTPSAHRLAPLESHALYVRGVVQLERGTPSDTALARQLFTEAARRDPASAQAQAGLALTYLAHPPGLAGVGPSEARSRAAEAVTRASALDRSAPAVQQARAELMLASGDWTAAELAFRRTIESAPNDAAGHEAYAEALALRGRFDMALSEGRRAQELDPLSPHAGSSVANTLRFARRYDEAIVVAQSVLRLDPSYAPAFHTLGLCYEAKGQLATAIEWYERTGRPSGNLAHAYAAAGRTHDARRLLGQFEAQYAANGTGAGEVARTYVGLGEYDRAFEWLQRIVDAGGQSTTLKVADVWDPLRADPRFDVLLARLGLDSSK